MEHLEEILKWVNEDFIPLEHNEDNAIKYEVQLGMNPATITIINNSQFPAFGGITLKRLSSKLKNTTLGYTVLADSYGKLKIIIF